MSAYADLFDADRKRKEHERERREAVPLEAPAPEAPTREPNRPPPERTVTPEAPTRQAPAPESTAPGRDGFTALPNWVYDEFLPRLDQYEQAVMFRLYRLTLGFRGRPTCVISYGRIADLARISENSVIRAVKRLVAAGHLETRAVISGRVAARGIEFRVMPSALPPEAPTRQAPARRVPASEAPAHRAPMTEKTEKGNMPDVFAVRVVAARLYEAHRGEPGFDHDRLRQLVRDALIGQGRVPDAALIDEATRGMGA